MRSRIAWLAALIALGALVALWLRDPQGPSPTDARPGRTAPEPSPGAAEPEPAPRAGAEPSARSEVAVASAPAAVPAKLPAERGRADLEVVVVDARGTAVGNALVRVRSHTGPRPELYALADDRGVERAKTADANGRAHFSELPTGPYEVLASANAGEPPASVRAALETPSSSVRVQLNESGLDALEVLVRVQGARGEPIAGATVELTGAAGNLRAGRIEGPIERSADTDELGIARFSDPGLHGLVALAVVSDGRKGSATAWTRQEVQRAHREGGLLVRVGAPASLRGALLGLPADRLGGARVRARLSNKSVPYYTHHGRDFETQVVDGRYAFEDLAPGTYTLLLDDSGGARLQLPRWEESLENSVKPLEVVLAPGAEVALDLSVAGGGVLEGLVLDESGAPLAGALVRATYAPRTSNVPDGFYVRGVNVWRFDSDSGGEDDHPETHRRARSDAHGRYRLAGLHPGRHRVEVAVSGRVYDRREDVALEEGATARLEHVLAPAGALQGIARGGGYLGVQRASESAPRMVAIVSNEGLFCFPGLEPGAWTVMHFHSDARVAPVPLVEVEIEAGRTTWVDLDRDVVLPVRIAGRVVDGAGPVAGAAVISSRKRVATDPQGRFEFQSAFPWTAWVALSVERGGLRTEFSFPGMDPGATRWEGELALGDLPLAVRTEDPDGQGVPAQLSFWLSSSERAEIREVHSEGLKTGPTGERVVAGLHAGSYEIRASFADGAEVLRQVALPRGDALVLRAPPVGSVDVLVRHPDGRPAAYWTVLGATWTGEGAAPEDSSEFLQASTSKHVETGADGRATLLGVRAGDVLVRADDASLGWGGADPERPVASGRLFLARGQRATLELTLRTP
jgi:protocatechuate 3,4-dioxygenase beta subunit